MFHAVILAGGSGKRFWPRSRVRRPKQLLCLTQRPHRGRTSAPTLIQAAVAQLRGLFSLQRMLIVTNRAQVAATRSQLPGFPAENIIGEPESRDSAAAIGLAAVMLRCRDPDAVMAVMPVDQQVRPRRRLHQALRLAANLAAENRLLVTFGVRPREPSVLFGYIERGVPLRVTTPLPFPVFRVARFWEKPNSARAACFVRSGRHYWNSGAFVWRADDILLAISRHAPVLAAGLKRIESAMGHTRFNRALAREYTSLPRISIDYAVMEKARNVVVVAVDYEWNDVGSWLALARLCPQDAAGNTWQAEHVALDTQGCIVAAERGHLIAALGVQNLIIVHTHDATLVCDRARAADVKVLVDLLARRGYHQYL